MAVWARWLLSLPQGDQAREIVGAPTAIARRLTNALAYAGRTESLVLLEEPETLDAELLQEEEAEAKAEAEKDRPGQRGSPRSPTGHGSTAVRQDTRWYGRGARPGWAPKPTWATTRRHMMQSALLSQGRWNRRHEG